MAIIHHPSSREKSALCSDHLIPRAAISGWDAEIIKGLVLNTTNKMPASSKRRKPCVVHDDLLTNFLEILFDG